MQGLLISKRPTVLATRRWIGASGLVRVRGAECRPVGGQQLFDAPGGMRGDTDQHVGEVGDHVDVRQAAALDQRVDHGGGPTAPHASSEEPVAASDRDGADGPFAGIVVEGDQSAVEEAAKGLALVPEVVEGLGHVAGVGELRPEPPQSREERSEYGRASC